MAFSGFDFFFFSLFSLFISLHSPVSIFEKRE
jgi:hypothetical protein